MKDAYQEDIFQEEQIETGMWCYRQCPQREAIIVNAHYHTDIEILYGTECDMTVWVNDNTYNVKTGDLLIIRPYETHAIASQNGGRHFVIKFEPSVLNYENRSQSEAQYMHPVVETISEFDRYISKDEMPQRLPNLVHRCFHEYEKKDFGYELALRTNILSIVLEFLRYKSLLTKKEPQVSLAKNTAIIHEAIDYMSANLLSADEKSVAEFCSMSYAHFSRVFKQVTGMSFSKYMTNLRAEKARRYLLTSKMDITEIAFATGYSSASHFIQNFKGIFGKTPLVYKKDFKEKFD